MAIKNRKPLGEGVPVNYELTVLEKERIQMAYERGTDDDLDPEPEPPNNTPSMLMPRSEIHEEEEPITEYLESIDETDDKSGTNSRDTTNGIEKAEDVTSSAIDEEVYVTVNSSSKNKAEAQKGVVTFVYTEKHGKRMIVDEEVDKLLGNPDKVLIQLGVKSLKITSATDEADGVFSLRKQGSKRNIYCSALLDEIVVHFILDFKGRTSLSFAEYKVVNNDSVKSVVVKMLD